LARLIAPLAAAPPDPDAIRALGAETWSLQTPPLRDVLGQRISSEQTADPWLRTIAAHALVELSAAFAPQQAKAAEPPPQKEKKKRRRRRSAADLLDSLMEEEDGEEEEETAVSPSPDLATVYHPPPALARRLNITDLMNWIQIGLNDPEAEVRRAAQRARAIIAGQAPPTPAAASQEDMLLSVIERIIFLKKVLFFQNMSVEQLKVLASVCEETFFPADTVIYRSGDPGGELYVVVSGRVAIEQPGKRKGSVVRLGAVDAYAYFGEMHLFTDNPRDARAVALQDTWTLHLRRDPLLALARQQPELSLEIINVLSQRLQEVTGQIADRTQSTPRELHKLFDQLES
jgi:CRP-like cAMP-binding protein